MTTDKPQLVVAGSRAWRVCLEKNRSGSEGIFLVLAKRGTTQPTSLTYAGALGETLCFGWIDGQARSCDDTTFTQSFTPRRKGRPRSKRNTAVAERLVAEGRMQASGIAEMDRAKADG